MKLVLSIVICIVILSFLSCVTTFQLSSILKTRDITSLKKLTRLNARSASKTASTTSSSTSYDTTSSLSTINAEVNSEQSEVTKLHLGQRVAYPGDFLVHEKYGVCKYIGIKNVNITPNRNTATYIPSAVLVFADGQMYWFKRIAEKELLMYRSFSMSSSPFETDHIDLDTGMLLDDDVSMTTTTTNALDNTMETKPGRKKKVSTTNKNGLQELSYLLDTKKWEKKVAKATEMSKISAMNLIKLMVTRNNIHRPPCNVVNDPKTRIYNLYQAFEKAFPYEPTTDQIESFQKIEYDMTVSTRPMDRLVCGDVGFGKTEVAMRAMYIAVLSNKQVAVLAPTRVLALQHLRSIQERMPDIKVALLRGGTSRSDSTQIKDALETGNCQIVVGTHSILSSDLKFKNLGLLIVDEEQRFGVDHKEKLKFTTAGVDVLTLSATPIPRTLHMSLSGLREFSLMNSPPKGRKEVEVHTGIWNNVTVAKAILTELKRGGQVFVVVPFVASCQIMIDTLRELIPGIKCIDAHGRHEDLELRIDLFRQKKAHVLVATTVIENGIDMPNVNTIIVHGADRFGMSALYQLRGRVGRSTRQAYAYFFTNTTKMTTNAENRLAYIETFNALGSGYELAMRDMDMRGHGSIFGEDQSGSCDVGIELQTRIMAQALEDIKKELKIDDLNNYKGDLSKAILSDLGTPPPPTSSSSTTTASARKRSTRSKTTSATSDTTTTTTTSDTTTTINKRAPKQSSKEIY